MVLSNYQNYMNSQFHKFLKVPQTIIKKKYKIILHKVDEIWEKKTKFMTPFGSLCSFGLVLILSLKGRWKPIKLWVKRYALFIKLGDSLLN